MQSQIIEESTLVKTQIIEIKIEKIKSSEINKNELIKIKGSLLSQKSDAFSEKETKRQIGQMTEIGKDTNGNPIYQVGRFIITQSPFDDNQKIIN